MRVIHEDILSSAIGQLWANRHYIPELMGVSANCNESVVFLHRHNKGFLFEIQSISDVDHDVANLILKRSIPEYSGQFKFNGKFYDTD